MTSRRTARAISVVAVLSVAAALAPDADAGPTAPSPGTQAPGATPGPLVKLPPRIWSVERVAQPKENPSFVGPITYSIEVRAGTTEPLNTTLRIRRGIRVVSITVGETLATLPVSAPAGGSVKVTFTDPGGLREGGCEATRFFLDLVGVPGTTKLLVVQAGCTFSATAQDPTASLPPDTKQAQRANRLQYYSPSIQAPLACAGQALKIGATVKNATSKAATSIALALDGPEDTTTQLGTLQPGETKAASLAYYGKQLPGTYVLELADPQNSVGGAIYQMGWNVALTRTCNPTLLPLETRPDAP